MRDIPVLMCYSQGHDQLGVWREDHRYPPPLVLSYLDDNTLAISALAIRSFTQAFSVFDHIFLSLRFGE
jgi:hypothetical protein